MSQILIGKGEQQVHLLARYGNRHGLIAGATGGHPRGVAPTFMIALSNGRNFGGRTTVATERAPRPVHVRF